MDPSPSNQRVNWDESPQAFPRLSSAVFSITADAWQHVGARFARDDELHVATGVAHTNIGSIPFELWDEGDVTTLVVSTGSNSFRLRGWAVLVALAAGCFEDLPERTLQYDIGQGWVSDWFEPAPRHGSRWPAGAVEQLMARRNAQAVDFALDSVSGISPTVSGVLRALPLVEMTASEALCWWTAANGWLGNRRPLDVIADDPDAVEDAARQLALPSPL
jgi:hypothetical protein